MHNYEIKIKVEINKTKESITNVVNQHTDRSFRLIVSNESAHSIDQCEKALLSRSYSKSLFNRMNSKIYLYFFSYLFF